MSVLRALNFNFNHRSIGSVGEVLDGIHLPATFEETNPWVSVVFKLEFFNKMKSYKEDKAERSALDLAFKQFVMRMCKITPQKMVRRL